jgi:tetratricopeptide (TPR) repeat protein
MENVQKWLAVNPLLPAAQRWRAEAAQQLPAPREAIAAYRALLVLDPADPAGLHHSLAELLLAEGDKTAARRHVLQALEEAPRYRAAQKLLLRIVDAEMPPSDADQPAEVPQ